MTMIAFARGALAALGRKLDAAPQGRVAMTYPVSHPMGVLRLPTPDEYEIVDARAQGAQGARGAAHEHHGSDGPHAREDHGT
jgi:hypothetical protein